MARFGLPQSDEHRYATPYVILKYRLTYISYDIECPIDEEPVSCDGRSVPRAPQSPMLLGQIEPEMISNSVKDFSRVPERPPLQARIPEMTFEDSLQRGLACP